MVAPNYLSLNIHSEAFAHEVVSRKDWGTCRSPKSYNLYLEWPLSQNESKWRIAIQLSQRYI